MEWTRATRPTRSTRRWRARGTVVCLALWLALAVRVEALAERPTAALDAEQAAMLAPEPTVPAGSSPEVRDAKEWDLEALLATLVDPCADSRPPSWLTGAMLALQSRPPPQEPRRT